MPVWHQRDDWFLDAVHSVLNEVDVRLELIVVDDGNEVSVRELLAEIHDPRLRLIETAHGGPSHARNVGLAAARGDYVRFVDADDAVVAGGTAALLRAAGGRYRIAQGAVEICDEHLRVRRTCRAVKLRQPLQSCLTGRFDTYHPALLFPRRVLDAVGGWPERATSEDWDLVLRALEIAALEPCAPVVYRYRRWPGSLSAATTAPHETANAIIRDHFERFPEHRGTKIERQAEAYLTQRELNEYRAASPWTSVAWWRAAIDNPTYLAKTALAEARKPLSSIKRHTVTKFR